METERDSVTRLKTKEKKCEKYKNNKYFSALLLFLMEMFLRRSLRYTDDVFIIILTSYLIHSYM